jgi:hypothetical protein
MRVMNGRYLDPRIRFIGRQVARQRVDALHGCSTCRAARTLTSGPDRRAVTVMRRRLDECSRSPCLILRIGNPACACLQQDHPAERFPGSSVNLISQMGDDPARHRHEI